MAKDKLTDYDSTASGNLDVGGVSVAEGMLPSGVNNAIRELMSHQADAFGSGTPLYVDQTNNRLGVGTASPATYGGKVNITDGSVGGETTLVVANNNANQFIRMGVNADVAQIAYDNADSLAFGIATDSTTSGLTTEHMRIDSSGRVGMGEVTSASLQSGNNTGNSQFYWQGNYGVFASDGDVSLICNRQASDGSIIAFRKDGTTVGSIRSIAGPQIAIGGTTDGLAFYSGGNQIYPCNMSTGGNRDATIDLGYASSRFKDLYLSGGVYLGGTGSANHLDDYEEGTWTPTTFSGWSVNPTLNSARYTKIGRLVILSIYFASGTSSTDARFTNGLPFVSDGEGHTGSGVSGGVTDVGNVMVNGASTWFTNDGGNFSNTRFTAVYLTSA